MLLYWSCLLLLIGSAIKNFWFYPSFFDLIYSNDFIAERVLSETLDISTFIESVNLVISIVLSGLLVQAVLFGFRSNLYSKISLLSGWLSFLFIFLTEWYEVSFQMGFLLENLLRLSIIPIYLISQNKSKNLYSVLLILTVFTFAGHGLYALNIFPRPAYFVDMIVKTIPISQGHAEMFLNCIGIIDLLLVSTLIFKRFHKWALLYMIIWGFLTTLARPVLNISWVFLVDSLLIWIPEFLLRGSHFLIPFGLFILWKDHESRASEELS